MRLPEQVELKKFSIPEFVYGSGASRLCGRYASKFGVSRVLVVSDPGVSAAGHAAPVAESLRAEGIAFELFTGISPNPRSAEVRRGVEAYLSSGCDAVVALGGGSVMDCAKGIGLSASNRADVLDFEGIDRVRLPGPPLICVPTTAGTAADVSQFAIINAEERGTKIAIVSKKAIPDVALIDPELTVTMDGRLTAATGMDVLSHALEAYASNAASPVTDLHALEAIRLTARYLPAAVAVGSDREARNGMMLASTFAGFAFSNAGLGAVHALSHALGGTLDLPHGLCNALLLAVVAEYNEGAAAARYAEMRAALAEGYALRGIAVPAEESLGAMLVRLRGEVELADGLGAYGVRDRHIRDLARKAYRDACLATNPRPPTLDDLERLYAAAL